MSMSKLLDVVALVLIIVGGLNWGLVGLFNYNLVTTLFGVGTVLSNVVFALVGLAAVYSLLILVKMVNMKEEM